MSAKVYRSRLGIPVLEKLKRIIKNLLLQYFRAVNDFLRVNRYNGVLYKENQSLALENDRLKEENGILRKQNKEYSLLRKVFGRDQVESWVQQTKEVQQIKKHDQGGTGGSGDLPVPPFKHAVSSGFIFPNMAILWYDTNRREIKKIPTTLAFVRELSYRQ